MKDVLNSDLLSDEQRKLLKKFYQPDLNKLQDYFNNKLEERFKYNVLNDPTHKEHKENKAIFLDLCRSDCKFFINNCVWIQNSRADSSGSDDKDVMFLLYPYQEYAVDELVKAITEGYDLPIEKSRDMGLSWLVIAVFVWGWLFHNWDVLVGSQKFENVDMMGNIKALLPKARYIIEKLPSFIRPELKFRVHDKSGLIIHPKSGATIAGESNNTNFGRSDRRRAILFDEFSSWTLTDKAAWQSCGSTTKCRIPLSTPNTRGTNCHFYTILDVAKKRESPYLRLHWSLNPVFSRGLYVGEDGRLRSPWYDAEEARATDIQEVRQELDIDYEASMAGKVYPGFSVSTQVSDKAEYNPELSVYVSWDFGLDSTAILWSQYDRKEEKLYIIDEYQNDGTTKEGSDINHYVDIVQSKPYKKGVHFGDPFSGENRSLAARGSSNARILRQNGIIFKSKRTKIRSRIAAARNIIPKIIVNPNCSLFIECLTSWQMVQPRAGQKTGEVPKHDEYSHLGEAFSYLAWMLKVEDNRFEKKIERKTYSLTLGGVAY